jgi:hypothetical protein
VVSQAAAEGALTGVQSVVEHLRLTIQNNRDVLMKELRSFNGVGITCPQGTFYALPDFRAYSRNSVQLAEMLLKKALVVTVPGVTFGMEGHLRLSYAGTVKDVTEGIKRMKWALDPNAPQRDLYWRPQARKGLAINNLQNIKTPAQGQASEYKSDYGLANHGLANLNTVYWNLPLEALAEEIVFRGEGKIMAMGPIVVNSGKHTGRSAQDKFVVREATSETMSTGANTTGRWQRISSTSCLGGCKASCKGATCSCRTAMPAPIRSTASRCASSPSTPGTVSSRATCSSPPKVGKNTATTSRNSPSCACLPSRDPS